MTTRPGDISCPIVAAITRGSVISSRVTPAAGGMLTRIQYYGEGLAGFERTKPLPGRLIVLEGTDGVGRSTQIALLREWLESVGYAVQSTGHKRSKLAGKGIKKAMRGHTLGLITANFFTPPTWQTV